jgi:hypothetical protein
LPDQNGAVRRKKALTIIANNRSTKMVKQTEKAYLRQAIHNLLSSVRSTALGPKVAKDDPID